MPAKYSKAPGGIRLDYLAPLTGSTTITVSGASTLKLGGGSDTMIVSGLSTLNFGGAAQANATRTVTALTGAHTLTAATSGAVYAISNTSVQATLPPAAVGLEYTFVTMTTSILTDAGNANFELIVSAGTTILCKGAQLTTAQTSLTLAAATNSAGNTITVVGLSTRQYGTTAINGTWTPA